MKSSIRELVLALSWMATPASVLASIAGAWLAAAFVFGVGIGDTWIIYPPDIGLLHWCVPVVLIGSAFWRFGFLVSSGKQVTLRFVFGVITVLCVIFAIIAPFYWEFHRERQLHDANIQRQADEQDSAKRLTELTD